jgi:uncharacterized protein (TIGR00661 family)
MKYLFVIQGEGRGHFTQALSLRNSLEQNGHEVVAVMVGSSAKRSLPDFFSKKIKSEIIRFQSPNFLPTPKGKSSFLVVSIVYNLILLPVYIQSLFKIRRTIEEKQPDVVINFYELLCGITYGVFNPEVPMVNVAHQYYFMTPAFHYTGKNKIQFKLLNFYSGMTAMNSSKILALSFREEESCHGKIAVVPPLLRKELINHKVKKGNYIHGYMLNSGYANELAAWSGLNLKERLHFFWDKKNVDKTVELSPRLTMHALDDTLFLEYMAGCKGYATTGGFESVCEAMYMQKPVLMVPTHIEQECNVIDAMRSDVGVSDVEFNLDILLDFIPHYRRTLEFKFWTHSAESIFMYELTHIQDQSSNVLATL